MPTDSILGPSLEILKKLGIKLPKMDESVQTKKAEDWQNKNLGPIQKFFGGTLEGLTGKSTLDNPSQDLNNARGYGNVIGELIPSLAGIPFLKGKKIFHGTPKGEMVSKGMKTDKNDLSDTLGAFSHFAESPDYASGYALGVNKHGLSIGRNATNIPAELPTNSYNLDLTQKVPTDDIARIAGVGGKGVKATLKHKFKNIRREGLLNDPETIDYFNSDLKGIIENNLGLEGFKKTGFDAIKYNDVGNPSWAVPDPNKVIGAYDKKPLGVLNRAYKEQIELPEGKGMLLRKGWQDKPVINAIVEPNYSSLSSKSINTANKQMPWESDSPINLDKKGYYDTGLGIKKKDHLNTQFTANPKLNPSYIDASWNSAYSPEMGNELIKQAEYLGIDFQRISNLKKLEDAIKRHPYYPK